jgi:hypothetical protein
MDEDFHKPEKEQGMIKNLLNNCKIDYVLAPVADGQAASASSIVDLQGFHGVLFLALTGDVTSGCVLTLAAQQNTLNQASGMATLSGTATFTAGASDADNKILALDVVKPRERYVRAVFTSATQNAVKSGVIAVRYGAEGCPVAPSSDCIDYETIMDAAEA